MRPEHWLFTIPLRLRSLLRWAQADQQLDDELHDHLERKTDEYVAQGMTQEEAYRRARLDLDGIEQTKEECRDAHRVILRNSAPGPSLRFPHAPQISRLHRHCRPDYCARAAG
jgi:hypothetical protein